MMFRILRLYNTDVWEFLAKLDRLNGKYRMLLSASYSRLIDAAGLAANSNELEPITSILTVLHMSECEAEDYKFKEINSAYELVDQDERLFVQYRWYDTSKAFSMQPDMNVYMFRHIKGGLIVAENEVKFLDKSIY